MFCAIFHCGISFEDTLANDINIDKSYCLAEAANGKAFVACGNKHMQLYKNINLLAEVKYKEQICSAFLTSELKGRVLEDDDLNWQAQLTIASAWCGWGAIRITYNMLCRL